MNRPDEIEVHPAAAIFPMLADDELQELADDIKANGLIHPIVLDLDGVLIDGRNRLRACEIADVTPTFIEHKGDPLAFIVSANSKRRNMTKGAIDMTLTRLFKLNNAAMTQEEIARAAGIDRARVAYASMVITYAPASVPLVISGGKALHVAYEEAKAAKNRGDADLNELEALRRECPELAQKVVDGELTLVGARAELNERKRKRKQAEDDFIERVQSVFAVTGSFSGKGLLDQAAELEIDPRRAVGPFFSNIEATKRGLRNLLDALEGMR